MKERKIIRTLTASMIIALTFGGLTACGNENSHVHDYTKWEYNDSQHWKVCEEDGAESTHVDHFFNPVDDYVCECGAQHTHVYEWKHNAEYHWQECSDGFKTRKEQHSFDKNGVCKCGEKITMTEIHGNLKIYNNGKLENDFTGVTLKLTETESDLVVDIDITLNENGDYSFMIPQSEKTYTLKISKDGYLSDSIAFTATSGKLREAKLVYVAYATNPGMENWGTVDYSRLSENTILLDNDLQFIFTKKTYNKVAFSIMLQKDWNSANKDGRQGVIFRFKDGDTYKGIASIQTEGDKRLQCDGQTNYGKWWGMGDTLNLADGGSWNWIVNFDNRADLKEAINAGTLKLTVLRDGAKFYAYLNDEYVGFKKYDDKYADMPCEAGFYYFDFESKIMRDWHIELIEDTTELEEKIPAGSLNAVVEIKKNGAVTPLADGEKVKVEGGLLNKEIAIQNGKLSLNKLVPGSYKFSIGEDYTTSITIEKNKAYTNNIVLQYNRFELLKGWDKAEHDFSHVNDENPTIGNNGKTLNVLSRDKYDDVAGSLWMKDGNSTNKQGIQGIVIKFDDGKYMITRCEKMDNGNYKLQWVASNKIWDLTTAKDQWLDYQSPLTETQDAALKSEDGLKVTLVRSKNVLNIFVNGEKINNGTVILDEAYSSKKAQIGYFDYDSKANATWKFDIKDDISAYDTSFESIGEYKEYKLDVNLTGDVWQAMKVKVEEGYTGEVRIGFMAWHEGASKGYVKSICGNNGNWKLQETDTWSNEANLSEEFVNALMGEGLYIAYHRNAENGYVKMYLGTSKESLVSAIENGTAITTFDGQADVKKNAIKHAGVIFWKGNYNASAFGYSYGSSYADALRCLA